MPRILIVIFLFLWVFPAHEAAAQPRRTLLDDGAAGRITAAPQGRGEVLRLTRAGRTLFEARDQRFAPFRDGTPIPIADGVSAIGFTGWTGGAYCCFTLHLFHRGPQGLAHVASLPLGKREPDIIQLGGPPIRLADAAFDFWEVPASLATDLHPTIPFRWTGRALEPDIAAMRRPVAAALGTACADMTAIEDRPPADQRITTYPDAATAIAALRAQDWAARRGTHPGVEAARLAACLVYAGQAPEAQRLLRAAWPEGTPGLAETERQLAARIACSPFAAAVRAANPPRAPYTTAACRRDGPDQTAVFGLNWR
ncbi:hypothetical protein [Roseomonas sp. CECT 9278]|uniref:hypothetical protein n=1 Tax=Roseomonas sp. CECT 9278 TaxID=2845823 RepID=UPI001E5FE76C|nr:hypothetical protein [Roseomonas sp. CECT 9278]CAH0152071.1 hypothetical protein ROS9278_00742 [Roseomonas sp. CECT 9278]